MQNTAPVIEDGRVLVSAIKDGYNAYLTYTEQLLKLHNENMARLLSDAVAINPWWSPNANATLGEWADLYVSSVESTIDWVRRVQQSPAGPFAAVTAHAVQGNGGDVAPRQNETAGSRGDSETRDVRDEPANDARLMQQPQDVEQRNEEPPRDAGDGERGEHVEAPATGRRPRAGGERQR